MTTDPQDTKRLRVDLEPVGRRAEIEAGATLLAAAQSAGVELMAICGGAGSCASCRVRPISGELSPPTQTEQDALSRAELTAGFRLACQAVPLSDVKVDIPPTSLTTPQRLQLEGQEVEVELDPAVVPLDVHIEAPSLYDLRADASRLQATLATMNIPPVKMRLPLLEDLSTQLRDQKWAARLALRDAELVAVLPSERALVGLAVDLGTTKLAGYLLDLSTGKTLAKTGAMNPQIAYGEDVVSRIAYSDERPENRRVLQQKLVETLNTMVTELSVEAGTLPEQIVEAVIVGNTAMQHLFAGLPVRQLGLAPYVPAVSDALEFPASEVGLSLAPGAYVHLPPNIAGYVGADHVAMLLSTGMGETQRTIIALDIGTNTEISLSINGRLLCCSCASGPAFEGAHIHDGMRAAPGAIERVQIIDDQVRTYTIGGLPPVGICGSGILDAVAEMLSSGLLDHRGKLQKDHPRIRKSEGLFEFVLATAEETGHGRDVIVNRKDVTEIQLAKGAIRAGIETLLAEGGVSQDEIDELIIAGAFGTYLDVDSAVRVGMFPSIPRQRFRQVGNAAGTGARQILVSRALRQAAAEIRERVEYIELTTHHDFTRVFMRAMSF